MQNQEGFKKIWKIKLSQSHYRARFLYTLLFLLLILRIFTWYIIQNESREGVILDDPVFKLFTAIDLNIPIFAMIYLSLVFGLISLTYRPEWLLVALQTYCLMVIFRMIMMYVTPLELPDTTIDLEDPLVFIIGTGGLKLTKDLFFSGHTATLFLLFLTAQNKKLKYVFLICTILVGIFVILQKVHFTVDVLVAPFVSYVSYRIVILLNRNNLKPNQV